MKRKVITAIFGIWIGIVFFGLKCGTIAGLSGVDNQKENQVKFLSVLFASSGVADTSPPSIVSTNPENQSTGVSTNPTIEVEFNEEMDSSTITNSNIFVVGLSSLVQYSGKIAKVTPSTLETNKEYMLVVSQSVKDKAGNSMSSESYITFTTGTSSSASTSTASSEPSITSIFPADAATGIGLSSSIVVTFNKDINPGTLSNSSFQLWQGGTQIQVNTVPVGTTGGVMYPLSALLPNTTYTVMVTTAVTDNSSPPKPLASAFSSTFTTGNVYSNPISIVTTSPTHASNQISVGSKIVVLTDRTLDATTVTTANVSLTNSGAVAGTIAMLGNNGFIFTPSSPLPANTVHTFTVTTGILDTAVPANSLSSNYSFSFTTGNTVINTNAPTVTSVTPANGATGVSNSSSIVISFSEPIDPSSINATNITLMQGATPVPSTVQAVGDSVAVLTPNSSLAYNTNYTLTVTTGILDLSVPAMSMAANYTSSFTTSSPPILTVSGANPVSGSTNVPINTSISITFSQAVNAATLIPANITLTELPATSVSGTIIPVGTSSVLFLPSSNMNLSKTYTFTLTTGVTDTLGNPLGSNYTTTFTTTNSEPDSGTITTLAGAATSTSGYLNATGTTARFNSPKYLTMNIAETSVYVTDTANHAIRQVDYPTGVTVTFAGAATPVLGFTTGTGTAARFKNPSGIFRYFNGDLYVTDTGNNAIRRITTAAVVSNLSPTSNAAGFVLNGTAASRRFNSLEGIAIAYDVNGFVFYIPDTNNHTIRRVATNGTSYNNFVGSIAPNPTPGSADGVGTVAKFNSPKGIAIDANYNIYVTDTGNHTIRKITTAGQVITIAGSAGTSGYVNGIGSAARFNSPAGIAVGPNNVLYVTDTNNCAIRKITMDASGTFGTVSTFAGSVPPASCGYVNGTRLTSKFQNPVGLYVMSNGTVLVTDTGNHAIRVISP